MAARRCMVEQSDERDALRARLHGHVGRGGRRLGRARRLRRRARGARSRSGCSSSRRRGPGDRVLELACGPGGLGLAAAERVGPGGEVVLSDVAAEMTAIAAARAARAGPGATSARACSTSRTSTSPTARYDVVLCREGLMFAVDPAARRRARSGACCGPAGASRSPSGARASATRGSASSSTPSARRSARRCRRPGSPARSRSATPGELRRLLDEAGLADVQVGELAVPLRAASFDEWWARTSALAGPLAAILAVAARGGRAGHCGSARAQPSRRYETASGGLDFPGVTLIASGRARSAERGAAVRGPPSARRAATPPRPRARWPGGRRCASPGGARSRWKRPDSPCSSSTTMAWKRRPFLSTSTMSPGPMPFELRRGGAGDGGVGSSVVWLMVAEASERAGRRRPRASDGAARRSRPGRCGRAGAFPGPRGWRRASSTRSYRRPKSAATRSASRPVGVATCSSKASACVATGRKSKIPPPALSTRTTVSPQLQARGAEQTRRGRGRGRRRRGGRRRARLRRRRRRPRRACRRCRWRRGGPARAAARRAAGQKLSTSRTGIDEAVKTVTSPGSAASARATAGSEIASPSSATMACAAASSAPRQASSHALARGGPAIERAHAAGSASSTSPTTAAGSCQVPSGSKATCRTPSRAASHWRSGLQVGRSPTRITVSGRWRGGEALVAQQVVVVGDGSGAAPRAGERVGQQRRAEGRRRGRQRRGEAVVALVAAGDDERAPADLELDGGGRRGAPRRGGEARRRTRRQRLVEHERLAQREVQVHGARAPGHGRLVGAEGEPAHPAQPLGRRAVGADLEEPLRRAAVELQLVDRLAGPDLAQLGRAVGGEDDERDPRLVGLDHGRQVVRGRRPARARDRRGPPALLGHAEREEAGARARRRATTSRRPGWRASVSTSGVEREPGEVHAPARPQRASSSTNARSSR